eukprot:8968001-Prorocentrum_lima.AAC.1
MEGTPTTQNPPKTNEALPIHQEGRRLLVWGTTASLTTLRNMSRGPNHPLQGHPTTTSRRLWRMQER